MISWLPLCQTTTASVSVSDMRKLAQWYNILIEAGVTEFADEAPATEDNE